MLSPYEQAKLYHDELRRVKEQELSYSQKQKKDFYEDYKNQPDRVRDDIEGKREWMRDRAEAIRQQAASQAKKQAMKMTGGLAKKALSSASKRLIIPILEALGALIAAVGPWILVGIVILLIIALVIALKCEIVNSLPGLFRPVAGWFGIECGA